MDSRLRGNDDKR